MRTREEWERWYRRPDPWEYEGSDEDLFRTSAILARLGGRRFRCALDLGCGEGRLTNAMSAVSDQILGFDISETAIGRARGRFPDIPFAQGELLEVIRRPEVRAAPFDLILAAEVLYYLATDDERMEALAGMAALGLPECVYVFSVIVTGDGGGRRYFTHETFQRMLAGAGFEVAATFPCAVHAAPVVDRLIASLPSRRVRLALRGKWVASRDSSRWKHVAYLARRPVPKIQGGVNS